MEYLISEGYCVCVKTVGSSAPGSVVRSAAFVASFLRPRKVTDALTQDSPYFGLDANNAAKCQLFIKASVTFRGLKKDATNAALLTTLPGADDPTVLTQTQYPSEIKYSMDLVSDDDSEDTEDEVPVPL
jgi:hypothetical protein